MILQINNKQGNNLGAVSFSETNQPQFIGTSDKKFEQFVLDSLKNGIKRVVDVHTPENNGLTMIEEPVSQSDPGFPLAFKEFLERVGYEVIEKHPETEEEIHKLLADFPNDNEDKIDILKKLPEMSYLEQTIILEGLKKIQSEHK